MDYDVKNYIKTDEQTDARIKEGIEKNRKGNFCIKTDAKTVKVKLKNHKFRFGGNLFMLDEIPDKPEKNEIYKQKFKKLFNMATLPFYWNATEPEPGKTRYDIGSEKLYRRPAIDLCIKWCSENGIEPREHALCYDHSFPDWLKNKPTIEVKKHLEERMKQISQRYADKIPTIEVTNEMFWGDGWITDFYLEDDYVVDSFKMAEKYFPNNELGINEWSGDIWEPYPTPRNKYFLTIENALLKGARIDAIGMQYHMFYKKEEYQKRTEKFYDLKQLLSVMDLFAAFNKPIQITEITVPSFCNEEEAENLQADILEKIYSTWFSHPLCEQIIYWNMPDGYAAFAEPGDMTSGENYYYGGLVRFDMTEKAAYKRLYHLIHEVWTTDEQVECVNGKANFRGFYGEYEVEADGKKCIVNFDKDGKEICL